MQGTSVYDNPAVLAAIAAWCAAPRSAAAYMSIVAPVAGVVAQRTVQLGQRVAPGTPLMAVVPLDSAVGRRQFPRDPAPAPARRPAGDDQGRRLWRPT